MFPQGSENYFKAESFPLKWKVAGMVHDSRLHDATYIFFEGTWWQIGYFRDHGHVYLHVLYSNSLLGPWKDNPYNCFHRTVNASMPQPDFCASPKHLHLPQTRSAWIRPGGSIFQYKNSLYRMVQHAVKSYGDTLVMMRITNLTKTGIYNEEEVTNFISPKNSEKWLSTKCHHLSLQRIRDDYWVGLVDGDWQTGGKTFADADALGLDVRCADVNK
jgi:hypothetical protein